MTTLINHNYASLKINGLKTYFVIDSANQCLLVTKSERKAKNYFSKLLKNAGY